MNLQAFCFFGKSAQRFLAATSFAFAFVVCAKAQWAVVNLHPAGATTSVAYGGSGAKQVGYASVGGIVRACLWSGTAASWVDLHPAVAFDSIAYGASGPNQVGQAFVPNNTHAGLWSGTAGSWVDLNPVGSTQSYAYGNSGANQVGIAAIVGSYRASLWSGSAASWVDLHPAAATNSYAFAVSGSNQVGYATVGGLPRASLWSGTAASWVDLNPVAALASEAHGVSGAIQVGWAWVGGHPRASLWSGTAGSWVNLNPAVAADSYAYSISGANQVGYVVVGSVSRASLWSGTAASWVDLHALLPAAFTSSFARSISTDGVNEYISGYGNNSTNGRLEALLWVRQIGTYVQSTSYSVLQGLNFGGNLGSLLSSDNNKVFVLCDEFDSNGEIQFNSTLPAGTVSSLKFKFEGSATRNDLSQFVKMFNYGTNAYINVHVQTATLVDSVVEGMITTGVANYFSGTREVKSRSLWIPQADIDAGDGWTQACDQVLWTMN